MDRRKGAEFIAEVPFTGKWPEVVVGMPQRVVHSPPKVDDLGYIWYVTWSDSIIDVNHDPREWTRREKLARAWRNYRWSVRREWSDSLREAAGIFYWIAD